jgi:hypothetical protein
MRLVRFGPGMDGETAIVTKVDELRGIITHNDPELAGQDLTGLRPSPPRHVVMPGLS